MPAIPVVNQYYPSMPLKNLSDLYSVGDNKLNNKRICIISYLPKVLRVGESLPFNNKYVLFVEQTSTVTGIAWSYQLFNKGEMVNDATFINASGSDQTEYTLNFLTGLFDTSNLLKFDKLTVTCTLTLGAEEKKISVEHTFAKLIDVKDIGLISGTQSMLVGGNTKTTNYILNQLKDYLPDNVVMWNDKVVELGLDDDQTLSKIVTAIIYRNIEAIPAETSEFNFFYDINQFTDTGIKSYLNDSVAYQGNFLNGLCQVPLHILNDVFANDPFTDVPDFTQVDAGTGNPVYNIIRDNGLLTYNNLEGEALRTVPQKIQDSRLRITNDLTLLVELYNLTLFPKAAIILTAILVKYLFECSKKNQCNECKNKATDWEFSGLADLKEKQDFLNNILTHYFIAPSNKIESFSPMATKTDTLVWGPAVYTILNVAPRIVKAYFAKKVRKIIQGTEFGFDFERIDNTMIRVDDNNVRLVTQPTVDAYLGREVFLVIETLHCRTNEIICNIKPSDTAFTNQTTPQSLEVMVGANPVTNITATIGNYDSLKNNSNLLEGNEDYVKVNHADRGIVKLNLRPETLAAFDIWTNGNGGTITGLRGNTGNFALFLSKADGVPVFWGNDVANTEVNGEFLNDKDQYDSAARFRIVNRIVYEIYHNDNQYKPAGINRIGKISNHFIDGILDANAADLQHRKVVYFYHDAVNNEHYFGEFSIAKTPRWPVDPNLPNDLITMVEATLLAEYNRNGVHIRFRTDNSDRDFINLDCFAGLLGAMAVNNIADLGFNGFSMSNGSPGVSSSHINGIAGDLRYLRTNMNGDACLLTDARFDYDRQVLFNNSLFDYGWGHVADMLSENFTRNGNQTLLPHTRHYHKVKVAGVWQNSRDVVTNQNYPQEIIATGVQVNTGTVVRHNNHLHVQGYDAATVQNIIN
jgi:hypothetical protein